MGAVRQLMGGVGSREASYRTRAVATARQGASRNGLKRRRPECKRFILSPILRKQSSDIHKSSTLLLQGSLPLTSLASGQLPPITALGRLASEIAGVSDAPARIEQ